MFLLASCDKEISQAEAQKRAANIAAAQDTTSYKSIKSSIEYKASVNNNSANLKQVFTIDADNYYVGLEISGKVTENGETTKGNSKYFIFVADEGMVAAVEDDGKKTYSVICTDMTAYKTNFESFVSQLAGRIKTPNLDEEEILDDIKDGKDLNGSMSGMLSDAGMTYTFGADYAVKYFSNSASSFGVSMSVSANLQSVYSVSGKSRIEWKDNLVSEVSTSANVTVGENKASISVGMKCAYNVKVNTPNINDYTKNA